MASLVSQLLPHVNAAIAREVSTIVRRGRAPPAAELAADMLIANAQPLPEAVLRLFDAATSARVVDPAEDPTSAVISLDGGHRIALWRGDITTLGVDGIVNAANEGGLGCFQPSHRCVDNVIHRAAGPRLREACRAAMTSRGGSALLQEPIITPGFNLPAKHVLHITGPQVEQGSVPSPAQRAALAACYSGCLALVTAGGLRSLAFPCISTGLFGYPQADAASIAVTEVRRTLSAGGHAPPLTVVFCVFTPQDERLYRELLLSPAAGAGASARIVRSPLSSKDRALAQARALFRASPRVLICAGAGMSVKPPESLENVYVDPRAFAARYLVFAARHGYRTAYECMGLKDDPAVPAGAKWGQFAAHFHNMRWAFQPGPPYAALRAALAGKDVFVYTSNVDGCFERAGFDASRILAVQGDMARLQCLGPCSPDSVFDSAPTVAALRAATDPATGEVPASLVPRCPRCGGDVFANVNGGEWFLRPRSDLAKAAALLPWLDAGTRPGAPPTLILEVGAGFNTPGVTRLPMEALARAEAPFALLRVNPDAAGVPADLAAAGKACGLALGNGALSRVFEEGGPADGTATGAWPPPHAPPSETEAAAASDDARARWRRFFHSLTLS